MDDDKFMELELDRVLFVTGATSALGLDHLGKPFHVLSVRGMFGPDLAGVTVELVLSSSIIRDFLRVVKSLES